LIIFFESGQEVSLLEFKMFFVGKATTLITVFPRPASRMQQR